jgi:two-component system, sporulation sensor kinase E
MRGNSLNQVAIKDEITRSVVTMEVVLFFYNNPFSIEDLEGLSKRISRRQKLVEPAIKILTELGVLTRQKTRTRELYAYTKDTTVRRWVDQLVGGILEEEKKVRVFMHEILDNLPLAVLTFDACREVIFINRLAQDLLGYTSEEMVGLSAKSLSKLFCVPGIEQHLNITELLHPCAPVFGKQLYFYQKNGNMTPLLVNVYPLFDESGLLQSNLVALQDLSLQNIFGELQQKVKFVFDSMGSGVMAIDNNYIITLFNKVSEGIFGVKSQEVIGKKIDVLGETEQVLRIKEILASGKELHSCETIFSINGDKHIFLHNSSLLRDAFGQIIGMIIVFQDITELRQMEKQLQEASNLSLIGNMAAGMAHEIRNPLTTIRGFIQMMQIENKNVSDRMVNNAKFVIDEIDRINNIIGDFLLLARPSEQEYTTLCLNQLMTDICILVESEAILLETTIYRDFAPNLPPINGDAKQLKQLFLNIIANAFQAMSSRGVLSIQTCYLAEDNQVCVNISDTGCGIKQADLDKIFDPFYTTKGNGVGLGLAISKRIVKNLGGEIRVRSELDKGTAFSICFPVGTVAVSSLDN